eukprot:jgi/Chlat1/2951/Chrsp2S04644
MMPRHHHSDSSAERPLNRRRALSARSHVQAAGSSSSGGNSDDGGGTPGVAAQQFRGLRKQSNNPESIGSLRFVAGMERGLKSGLESFGYRSTKAVLDATARDVVVMDVTFRRERKDHVQGAIAHANLCESQDKDRPSRPRPLQVITFVCPKLLAPSADDRFLVKLKTDLALSLRLLAQAASYMKFTTHIEVCVSR